MTFNVIGTDNVSPIVDQTARRQFYDIDDVYFGAAGSNKYVVKPHDWVFDSTSGIQYVVSEVSDMLVPTLVVVKKPVSSGELSQADVLIGNGPGKPPETMRLYIDKDVRPYRLTVDQRTSIPGTEARTCVIYRGTVLGGVGDVPISQVYDSSNNLIGNVVTLQLAALHEMTNYAVRTVPTCYTTSELVDNEIVTVVFYGPNGAFVSKQQLLVENTSYIPKPESALKYITGITLESPFLSDADPMLLQIPLSTTLGSTNLFGVVHYSNGETLRLPVDGVKFQLFGLDGYLATQISERIPLILQYNLSNDESAYGATIIGERSFVQSNYQLQTIQADGKYALKLYGYPVWIDSVTGYMLRWWLLDLARDFYTEVTPYVTYDDNSAGFKGTAYGVVQQMQVSIDMSRVNGAYGKYVHAQTIDFMLNREGSDHAGTVWTVGFELSQSPRYGRDNKCDVLFVNQNLKWLNISQGLTSATEAGFNTWLDRLYYQTKPLFDPVSEIKAPMPNMFALLINGQRYDYLINQWDKPLQISDPIADSSTIYVLFFKRTPNADLYLSVAGLPVFQHL